MVYKLRVRHGSYDEDGVEVSHKWITESWDSLKSFYRWVEVVKGETLAFSKYGDVVEIKMDVTEFTKLKEQCNDREAKQAVLFPRGS